MLQVVDDYVLVGLELEGALTPVSNELSTRLPSAS